MIKVTASEFAKNFGEYREAVHTEPVAITSHGRTTAYLVSPEQFGAIALTSRQAMWTKDLPEEIINSMRSRMIAGRKKTPKRKARRVSA